MRKSISTQVRTSGSFNRHWLLILARSMLLCRLADLVGMQVAYLTGKQYLAEWPDRTYGSKMIQLLFDDKRFGRSTVVCPNCQTLLCDFPQFSL